MGTLTRPEAIPSANGTITRPQITRTELIDTLLQLPEAIRRREYDLLRREEDQERLEEELSFKERELLLTGKIDGKNADIREAQMREHTNGFHEKLAEGRGAIQRAKLDLHYAQARFSALKAAARLLAGEGDA
jgi:hypothetical protein